MVTPAMSKISSSERSSSCLRTTGWWRLTDLVTEVAIGQTERSRRLNIRHNCYTKLFRLWGYRKPILVGHSWGAALALAYTLNYPDDVSGMVLLAPAAYPDKGESRFLRFASRPPLIGDFSLALGKPFLGRHILKQALAQAFYPQAVPNSYLKTACALWLGRRQVKAYIEDESALNNSLQRMNRRYSEIAVPVVIVTGDKDRIVSAKDNANRLHAAVTGSQLIELKDTGHEIPQTHPESIYSALSLISQSKNDLISMN